MGPAIHFRLAIRVKSANIQRNSSAPLRSDNYHSWTHQPLHVCAQPNSPSRHGMSFSVLPSSNRTSVIEHGNSGLPAANFLTRRIHRMNRPLWYEEELCAKRDVLIT